MPDIQTEITSISEKYLEDDNDPLGNYKKEDSIGPEPQERFYFVRIMFLLLGLAHFLPMTFFVTANAYWMYKFRNVSLDTTDSSDRTALQSYFASSSMVVTALPSLCTMYITAIIGHRIRATTRVMGSLLILVIAFILATAFVGINTDGWQVGFFVVTMVLMTVIGGVAVLMSASNLAVLAKFPKVYTKTYLYGEGIAGTFSAVLQIISLAASPTTTGSALIYFIAGTLVTLLALVLFYVSTKLEFFRYHTQQHVEDTTRSHTSFAQIMDIVKHIWPCLFIAFFLFAVPMHPSVTSLVVSEYSGNAWNDTYFVPVITFLYTAICGLIGRVLSSRMKEPLPLPVLIISVTLRVTILTPLVCLCNAQPRSHLPVVFPHDWEYILIVGIYSLTTDFFMTIAFLNISKLVPKEKLELAYMVMMLGLGFLGAISSPLTLLAVKIL